MTFLQLEYFRKIAEMRSLTAAANDLHVSQPAVSKVLHALEEELGCQLFIRNGRNYVLSPNGEIYLRHVESVFRELDAARAEMSDPNVMTGTVTVSPHTGTGFLPQIITEFRRQYPNICIRLVKRQFSPDRATSREADLYLTVCNKALGLYSSVIDTMKLDGSVELFTEDILCGVSKRHPLAQRTSVSLRELQNENLILLPEFAVTQQIIDRCAQLHGFSLRPSIVCSEWSNIVSLIKINSGVAFLPHYSWFSPDDTDIALLRLEEPYLQRTLLCSWSESARMPRIVSLFRNALVEYYSRLSD